MATALHSHYDDLDASAHLKLKKKKGSVMGGEVREMWRMGYSNGNHEDASKNVYSISFPRSFSFAVQENKVTVVAVCQFKQLGHGSAARLRNTSPLKDCTSDTLSLSFRPGLRYDNIISTHPLVILFHYHWNLLMVLSVRSHNTHKSSECSHLRSREKIIFIISGSENDKLLKSYLKNLFYWSTNQLMS